MNRKLLFLSSAALILMFTLVACAQKKLPVNAAKPASETKPATQLKLFDRNLIKNSDAETGNSDGWTNAGELKTIIYGDFGGGPSRDSPGPASRGDKYFYGRVTNADPSAVYTQKIDVGEIAGLIDQSRVDYSLGGWFGVANGSLSSGDLKISFLDQNNSEISTDQTADIKESERPEDMVMVERSKNGKLPTGTRKIEVSLEFHIYPGHTGEDLDNLSFADNLSLILINKGEN